MSTIASPCIDVCRLDPDGEVCVGCFRSLDEIARWSAADDGARLAILAAAARRRAGCDPQGAAPDGGFRGDCER